MLLSVPVLPLVLFVGLVLVLALLGLAAAGHFPRERRAPPLRSPLGALVLFGSLAAALIGAVSALALAWNSIPWYAAIIGGGAAILVAPLVLQLFPDKFVDSQRALIGFASIAALLAVLSWSV